MQVSLRSQHVQATLDMWARDPIIAESARKHGVSDEDILHAFANPIRVFDLEEGFTMVIGANLAAII